TIRKKIAGTVKCHDLLVPIFRRGELVYERPSISQSRSLAQTELGRFHPAVKRLLNPHIYPVGLELGLHESKARLMQDARSRI
ncbi:MAG TPA: nicotinate phosphoribosyltransferase, partial [Chthoniobacterales bacterium]|nr:nicotinate phosphoribosyltransferase [Chthoniobacterales bacterium]